MPSKEKCTSSIHLTPGDQIRLRRRYLGWTLIDLGRRTGFMPLDIQMIESSEGELTGFEAAIFGRALGINF